MPQPKKPKKTNYQRLKDGGRRMVSLDLTHDEYADLHRLAGLTGVSKVEFCRRLVRFAIRLAGDHGGQDVLVTLVQSHSDTRPI